MLDRRGLLLLVGLVVVLGAIVVWSLPRGAGGGTAGSATADAGNPGASDASDGATRAQPRALERLSESGFEMAIVVDKSEAELGPVLDPANIAKLVQTRHCGSTCEKVRALVVDKSHFDTEVIKTDDWQLPPSESFSTIAPGLTETERARLPKMPNVIVVRVHARATREQWAARTGFAAVAAIAEHLHGYVYDEVVRRIETAEGFSAHAITESEKDSAFRPDRIVIQSYKTEGGTVRLLTLGMIRFGMVDVEVRGAPVAETARLGLMMNAVCARLAEADAKVPLSLTAADLAQANRRTTTEVGATASGRTALDLIETERTEGDADNEMLRIVPAGADESPIEGALSALFGNAAQVVRTPDSDPALKRVREEAQKALPRLARVHAAGATLTLKADFVDRDAGVETMWVQVTSCGPASCSGTLANGPVLLTDLHAGDAVKVPFAKVVDYILVTGDGGREGGESMQILSKP